MPGCASIILAAGASSRLGEPKQLLRLRGESLVHRTVRLVIAAGCSPVIVVLGAHADRIRLELNDLAAVIVNNAEWAEGMGASIRCGMAALQETETERVLLSVCDQPQIDVELLAALIAAQTGDQLVAASRYNGALGVPAVFSSGLFPQLRALAGDRGARALIAQYADRVACVDFPGGGFDVDTVQDAAKLSRLSSH